MENPEEKKAYNVAADRETPPIVYDQERKKSVAVGEAADLYGDVDTAEQYGYVERG
jgi:amino acid transporter